MTNTPANTPTSVGWDPFVTSLGSFKILTAQVWANSCLTVRLRRDTELHVHARLLTRFVPAARGDHRGCRYVVGMGLKWPLTIRGQWDGKGANVWMTRGDHSDDLRRPVCDFGDMIPHTLISGAQTTLTYPFPQCSGALCGNLKISNDPKNLCSYFFHRKKHAS